MRLWIAGGTLLGAGAAITVAAYLDQAAVNFTPVGGTYDIAFIDPGGEIQQGDPTPYEIDTTGLPPIGEIGSEPAQRVDLVLRNVGNLDSGSVTLTLQSLLPKPPPDGDGVVRDPFAVLLVSAWDTNGNLVADAIDPKLLAMQLESWPAGEDRKIALQFAYKRNLGTPYYFGKDVRIGVTVNGVSS